MPELAAELAADQAVACKVCAFLDSVPATEAVEWAQALALPKVYSHESLVRALRRREVDITTASVKRHRSNHGPR